MAARRAPVNNERNRGGWQVADRLTNRVVKAAAEDTKAFMSYRKLSRGELGQDNSKTVHVYGKDGRMTMQSWFGDGAFRCGSVTQFRLFSSPK